MREFWSEAAGGYLRYLDLPGAGVPILFVHGLGCAGSHDYPQVAADPALAGHRRILVDLLGCGYSDRPAGFGYRASDHAAVLDELVGGLGLEKFVLFGHSAGGAVALELARRVPERLTALALSEANLDPSPVGAASYEIAGVPEAEFVARGFADLVAASRDAGNRRWAAVLAHWDAAAVWRLAVSLRQGQEPSGRQVLYGLDLPRVYLIGERSLPDPEVAELPRHGIDVVIVPAAGHSMAWENPAGLANALSASLGRVAWDGSAR